MSTFSRLVYFLAILEPSKKIKIQSFFSLSLLVKRKKRLDKTLKNPFLPVKFMCKPLFFNNLISSPLVFCAVIIWKNNAILFKYPIIYLISLKFN